MSALEMVETQCWNTGSLETEGNHSLVITQDTSVVADVAMLDRLDKASQEIAVTRMLDQSKQWLDRAMEATNPAREVAEFKAFVATVSEASKQKKLSEGIQLDSTEMVRRAERALGVAIRKGQEAGEIADKGQRNVYAGPHHRQIADSALSSPTEFARKDELTNSNGGIYDMTDGVSNEQFEEALAEAKDEGNLSRANVVRKVKSLATFAEEQDVKWERIAELAAGGLTSAQIAKQVGLSEEWLRRKGRERGVEFHADKLANTRRIKSDEVLERLVMGIEVTADSISFINFESISPEYAGELLERLNGPMRVIRKMQSTLKGIAND